MRLRFVAGVMAFFVVVAVVLAVVLFGPNLQLSGAQIVNQPLSQGNASTVSNVIVNENAHLGTSSWRIPIGAASSTQIQAYAGATSVSPGQKLTFYVSTQQGGTSYLIAIYRLGWYESYGGRLMTTQGGLIGQAQGYYDPVTHRLVRCSSCSINTSTGLVEANWQPSYELAVPPDWTTGVYLAKFIDANGKQTYVPFEVRSNFPSRYVAVTSDTTYAAYNDWGGYSLYDAEGVIHLDEKISGPRGVKVSFDRPYAEEEGSGQVLIFEINAIRWLERQGYDISYISNVDLHENPALLLSHRAYLSLGHDEYWTKEMLGGVEYARDRGVGLAFLGADDVYWQMRFEPDSAGIGDRTIVCYKVETAHNDLANDPLYGVDNSHLTAEWRDPVLARPENALIGIMYSSLTHQRAGFPWRVTPQAGSWLLNGTGLLPGQQYGCGLVGYEWDHIFDNGATPKDLQVLGTSSTLTNDNSVDSSNTTYYIASSGAMVFATGAIYWTAALDNYRFQTDRSCLQQSLVVPGMQKLMARVMDELAVLHNNSQQSILKPTGSAFSFLVKGAENRGGNLSSLLFYELPERYLIFDLERELLEVSL